MISEADAQALVRRVGNRNLQKHMIAVSAIMAELAKSCNEDSAIWKLAGLLHDIDYELTDMHEHGKQSAEMLAGKLPEEALHAIRSHNKYTGFFPVTSMDHALIASDALSGLIVATALVMPSKTIVEVRVETLKDKVKDKSFAKNIDRKRLISCEQLGLTLEELYAIGLKAMNGVAGELGL